MTDTPKRRGRPPRPRPLTIPNEGQFEPGVIGAGPVMPALEPGLSVGAITSRVKGEPTPIQVTIITRKRGGPTDTFEAEWPTSWPIPVVGQSVRYGIGSEAVVNTVRFDLDHNRIELLCS